MKRLSVFLLSLICCFSMSACSGASSTTASSTVASSSTVSSASSAATSAANSAGTSNALEVEENLFDVEITLPASLVGETTQEELEAQTIASHVHSVTLNEDGSATYVMSKAQHAELMKEVATSINQSLSEMVGSEDYPNITSIVANDDFTVFTITTTSTELTMQESFSTLGYYLLGGMYNTFAGNESVNIHVDFINADSGEVISSADSSSAGS